jgi:hypothetical protein
MPDISTILPRQSSPFARIRSVPPAARAAVRVSKLLEDPITLRLLKKVQMPGGKRWAE